MVQINVAHTTKINPEGATPVLTHSQVWNALQRKMRAPQEFVSVMESCEVLEDKDGVVKRRVVFKKGVTPWDEVVEVATSFWPDWVSELSFFSRCIELLGFSGLFEHVFVMIFVFFFFISVQCGSKYLMHMCDVDIEE